MEELPVYLFTTGVLFYYYYHIIQIKAMLYMLSIVISEGTNQCTSERQCVRRLEKSRLILQEPTIPR